MNAKLTIATLGAVLLLSSTTVFGDYVGKENFDYADGTLVGKDGGEGWNRAPSDKKSSWTLGFGSDIKIENKKLVLNGAGVKRIYGFDEHPSAFNNKTPENSRFFISMKMTVDDTSKWSGFSMYDFGTERVFMGWNGSKWMIQESQNNTKTTYGDTIPAIEAGKTVKIVGMHDYNTGKLKFWINPDGNSTEAKADIEHSYNATQWNSNFRLASAGRSTFDDVIVATTFDEAANVPEPATMLLLLGGTVGLISRRRKRV